MDELITPEEMYLFFVAALRQCVEQGGHGSRKRIGDKAGLSPALIGSLLKSDNEKCAKIKSQKQIAAGCGYTYKEFLLLGKKLIEGDKETQPSGVSVSCPAPLSLILQAIVDEYSAARDLFPDSFHSRHEGYAVLLEEVDELWDAIKANKADSDVRAEAVQVCAMAIRIITDCLDSWNKEQPSGRAMIARRAIDSSVRSGAAREDAKC